MRRRPGVGSIWLTLSVLIVLYAAHEALGFGGAGTNQFFDQWLNDALLWSATTVCFAGALRSTRSRAA